MLTQTMPVAQVREWGVLAAPYPALSSILANYSDKLASKIIVDITNPVNFDTFDNMLVPAYSSASKKWLIKSK